MSIKKLVQLIFLVLIVFACSTESKDPMTNNNNQDDQGNQDDDNNQDPDDDPADLPVPRIAIVGEDRDDLNSLFLVTWDDDYQTNLVTDIGSALNTVNPEIYHTSKDSPGSFYIRQQGTSEPAFYRYDINTATYQTFPQEEYFNPSATPVSFHRLANEDYIHVFYLDKENPLEQGYYHTYNVNTTASREFPILDHSIDGFNVRITQDYAFIMFEETIGDDLQFHIFNANNGDHAIIPFDFSNYSRVIHNPTTNEVYLFIGTGSSCVQEYEIFNLNTFQITGTESLQSEICIPGIISKAKFFGSKMLYQRINGAGAGAPYHPGIYDFVTGENSFVNVGSLPLDLLDITNLPVSYLVSIDADLETETIIAAFIINENDVESGVVAFLDFNLELKRMVMLDNIIPGTILFR